MTAVQDNLKKNLQALTKSSFNVKFSLEGTAYEAIENIGSGAYGVVCSAVHRKTKRKVAIKKIPDIFAVTATAKRTYREIKILRHFKHDNIVAIREILQPPDQLDLFKDVYVVLDLMESDLHRIIYSNQELTEEHVRYFLYQILRAMKYIHSASVIHRDLKPSNLLVNENCDLKVGDFGMARGVSSDTEQKDYTLTQYVATRWYRAPEIMLCVVSYTTAVDMWSIGCIFAEMLRRKHLFPGKDGIDQLRLIIGALGTPSQEFLQTNCNKSLLIGFVEAMGDRKPIPFNKLCPKASPVALDLLSKLLVIDPQKRLSAAEALKHPFLAKYHDPDDEPECHPAFNFDFENQFQNSLEVDHSLKDAILAEIAEYKQVRQVVPPTKPTPAKPVRNEVPALKNSSGAPLASSLEAFLKKMKQSQAQLNQRMQMSQSQKTSTNASAKPLFGSKNLCQKDSSEQTDTKVMNKSSSVGSLHSVMNVASGHGLGSVDSVFSGGLIVSSNASGQTDVEMLSAKGDNSVNAINQTVSVAVQPDICDIKKEAPVGADAKALIKAALIRKKQDCANDASSGKPRPVTAHQRMKEREEKRKEKLKKVAEKRKMKKKSLPEKEPGALGLTSDDKNMLERWRTMQQNTVPFVHPIRNLVHESKDIQTHPINAITPSSTLANQTSQSSCSTGNPLHHKLVTSGDGLGIQPQSLLTSCETLQTQSVVTSSDDLGIQTQPLMTSVGMLPNHDSSFLLGTTHADHSSGTVPINIANQNQGNNVVASAANYQPLYTESVHLDSLSQIQATFSDSMSSASRLHTTPAQDISLFPSSAIANTHETTAMGMSDMADLTRQFSRHIFPPMLAVTPKGTGEGYGLGIDLDTLLNEALQDDSKKSTGDSAKLDSAPLSASLLQDWLEVSGHVDLNDLDALQKEMKSPMLIS